MARATIAVLNLGPEGLSWNRFLLAGSACFSKIHFLHIGHRASCFIFFPGNPRSLPFVKTKMTSHCLHVTVMSCRGPSATASVCCCDATSSVSTSSIGIWIWSRREKIRPFRLVRSGVFSLLKNSVWSPERTIDISLLIAAHFVSIMVHVPSFPFGSPSWTDVWLTYHHDTAFVMHMIPHQVLPIVLPAGHHLYSCPKSVSDDVFPMTKAKIKPVIWSRPIPTFVPFFKVSIACNLSSWICSADKLNFSSTNCRRRGLYCFWIEFVSWYRLQVFTTFGTSLKGTTARLALICCIRKQIELLRSISLDTDSGFHLTFTLRLASHWGAASNVLNVNCL